MIVFEDQAFHLQTKNTSYVILLLKERYLLQAYYGTKIRKYRDYIGNCPVPNQFSWEGKDIEKQGHSADTGDLPFEYPTYGSADFREPAFHAEYPDGSAVTCLEYDSYEIYPGKKPLSGLPASYAEPEDDAESLEITLKDKLTGLSVVLTYTVFYDYDVITKSVRAENHGTGDIRIERILSSSTYLFHKDYDFVHLHGTWAKERNIQKRPLINGEMSIDSKSGVSGWSHSPFVALAEKNADEERGSVYAVALMYSGNHIMQAETTTMDVVRINAGINPFGFRWKLEPDACFQAPEAVLVYSDEGFGKMSRIYHRFIRQRICRGKYRDGERPLLINNWEVTFQRFDEETILSIAQKAKEAGIELMVLDDGWFGDTPNDIHAFGDWKEDRNKLPGGIRGMAEKIADLGMKFGLWFEPEIISEDSELYKAHPEWCIEIPDRAHSFVGAGGFRRFLDFSRSDVCDYIVKTLSDILHSADISYIKWDMNCSMTELGSYALPKDRQAELCHRYMLGLYGVLERLTGEFPDILFEGCASGGGRFDLGLLCYFVQYWTSDCTDALERLYIQHGTSMLMPASAMSAHVTVSPNRQTGRAVPLDMRAYVAMMGQFGYEMDLGALSEEEFEKTKEHIRLYRSIRKTVHEGEMYRLGSPFEGDCTAWEFADDTKAVLMYSTMYASTLSKRYNVKLRGLDKDARYQDTETGEVYDGDFLMYHGLNFSHRRDYETTLTVLEKVMD